MKMRGSGGTYLRGSTWWIHYNLNGKTFRESARTDDEPKARRFLRHRLDQTGAARQGVKPFIPPKAQKTTINELLDSLERELKLENKLSPSIKANVKHLRERFGFMLAVNLAATDIETYIEQLLSKYKPASVNRHTQLLQQAYNLAIRQKRLNEKPYFKRLSEKGNARKGFTSRPQLDRVIAHLPEHLRDLALFAFLTSWRRGEILSLEWVSVHSDAIRLSAEDSKEREARSLALEGELNEIIERRRKHAHGPLIFHNGEGKPFVDFRKSWRTATRLAGVPGLLFHDQRRSGVRDMIRAGVAPLVAMSISGHKTDSMLRRYAIISEADQRAALRRTQEFRQAEATEQGSAPVLSTQVQ
jgi:integrase